MSALSIWLIYRAFVISIGLVCIILGYKLLVKGIFDGGADISGAWDGNKRLIIRRASPGALLFIFGFGIISISILFSKFTGPDVPPGLIRSLSVACSPSPHDKIATSDKKPVNLSENTVSDKPELIASQGESKDSKEGLVPPEQVKPRPVIVTVQGKALSD